VEFLPPSERAVAARTWQELEAHVPEPGIAASWDWVGTWVEHYGDEVPHRFAVGMRSGKPCGLALVTTSWDGPRPLRVRLLHIGTAGEPSGEGVYVVSNRVLSARHDEVDFARALLRALRRRRDWGTLVLARCAPERAEPFLSAWPRLVARPQRCPTVDLTLARSSGEVIATLRPRTRNQIRRAVRRLGTIETEIAAGADRALVLLDELIDLHQRRWRREGLPGAFASPRFRAFHRDLVRRLEPRGAAMLVRVYSEVGTIGCIYNLIQGREVLSYQMGLMDPADPKIKPGFVAHWACMQSCFERGLEEYNLLPEPTGYKLELANCEREMISLVAHRRTPRSILLRQARRLKQAAGRAPRRVR
jgi:CelD/BcsL family acetyltransferase involved in cellulose biosynthesis